MTLCDKDSEPARGRIQEPGPPRAGAYHEPPLIQVGQGSPHQDRPLRAAYNHLNRRCHGRSGCTGGAARPRRARGSGQAHDLLDEIDRSIRFKGFAQDSLDIFRVESLRDYLLWPARKNDYSHTVAVGPDGSYHLVAGHARQSQVGEYQFVLTFFEHCYSVFPILCCTDDVTFMREDIAQDAADQGIVVDY